MLKERAASAAQHGLPVPTPPVRARAADVGYSRATRTSSVPPSGRPGGSANRRMPLALKLLGIGLLLLGAIYGLTLFRDHHTESNAAAPPEATESAPSAPSPASTPLAHAAVSVSEIAAEEPAPTGTASLASPPSVDPPPVAPAINVPSARRSLSAPAATKPTLLAPAARKMGAIANPSAIGPNAAPAVAPAGPRRAPPKVDNPY